MLGQTQQNAATHSGPRPLRDWAFERRTAGSYSYRAASANWRTVVMATLDKWYAYETPRATKGIDRYPVASLVDMPPHMGTAGRSTGGEIAQQLQAAGWGVVFVPEGGKGTIWRVSDAERAEKLTLGDPTETAVVLVEPAGGWKDIGALASVGRYIAFPAMAVVGFVVTMAAMAAVR